MRFDLPELTPPTDRFRDLTEAEQLVVRSLRCWLAGGRPREMLWRSLAYELDGGPARDALQGLEAMIRVLTAHARRNIAYHQPCCPCIGADEAGLLALVTAVQRGQPALALLVAGSFVHPAGLTILMAAADMFAAALTRAARALPLRFTDCATPAAEDGAASDRLTRTVH